MNIKEWFKPGFSKNEIKKLEEKAQENIDNQENSSSFDAMGSEYQEWLLKRFPKTSDGTTADDYALRLILGKESRFFSKDNSEKENKEDRILNEIEDGFYDQLVNEFNFIISKSEKIESLKFQLFQLENEIEIKKGLMDAFEKEESREDILSLSELEEKRDNLQNKIRIEGRDLSETRNIYIENKKRYSAYIKDLPEDEQSDMQQLN